MAQKVTVRVTRIRQRVIQVCEPVRRERCESCQREVEMVTDAEAARVLAINRERVAVLLSEGSIHAIQSVSGNIWVCKDSLFLR